MSAKTKSTTLYPHPFSAGYWRDAAAELKDTRMLVGAALLTALRIALKPLAIPLGPQLSIQPAMLATALGAMVYGPVVAAICAVATDILGYLQNPEGVYFIPFVLTEVGGSVLFALFLYRAKVTPTRVILSRFCICLFVNILLQTPIMMLYYQVMMGGKSYVLTVPQILKNLFMFPIESVLLTIFLAFMQPITYRMKLTYNSEASLHFTKKQVALLVLLFIFGSGCVVGYLSYHYENTSITTGYTTEERVEQNQRMYDIITEEVPETAQEPAVAIIDAAYKPFLSGHVSYYVSFYGVDPEVAASEEMDSLWELKKTPASQHEALTKLGSAEVVMDERSGEMLHFEYTPAE